MNTLATLILCITSVSPIVQTDCKVCCITYCQNITGLGVAYHHDSQGNTYILSLHRFTPRSAVTINHQFPAELIQIKDPYSTLILRNSPNFPIAPLSPPIPADSILTCVSKSGSVQGTKGSFGSMPPGSVILFQNNLVGMVLDGKEDYFTQLIVPPNPVPRLSESQPPAQQPPAQQPPAQQPPAQQPPAPQNPTTPQVQPPDNRINDVLSEIKKLHEDYNRLESIQNKLGIPKIPVENEIDKVLPAAGKALGLVGFLNSLLPMIGLSGLALGPPGWILTGISLLAGVGGLLYKFLAKGKGKRVLGTGSSGGSVPQLPGRKLDEVNQILQHASIEGRDVVLDGLFGLFAQDALAKTTDPALKQFLQDILTKVNQAAPLSTGPTKV